MGEGSAGERPRHTRKVARGLGGRSPAIRGDQVRAARPRCALAYRRDGGLRRTERCVALRYAANRIAGDDHSLLAAMSHALSGGEQSRSGRRRRLLSRHGVIASSVIHPSIAKTRQGQQDCGSAAPRAGRRVRRVIRRHPFDPSRSRSRGADEQDDTAPRPIRIRSAWRNEGHGSANRRVGAAPVP